MNKRAGHFCISIGIILILLSIGTYGYFEVENKRAQGNSADVVPQLIYAAQQNGEAEADTVIDSESAVVKTIKGKDYVGYLSIPSLDINVPVMAECNYDNLKAAPCRYFGWAGTDNMVIAGHNYKCHFGRISRLKRGDKIIFTDMCNKEYTYQVEDMEILPPTAVDEMIAGEWALSLYTCTYTSKDRITIRCSEVHG